MLVLKELAINAPTFFFQKVQPFFDSIFNAVRDPKVRLFLHLYNLFLLVLWNVKPCVWFGLLFHEIYQNAFLKIPLCLSFLLRLSLQALF